MSDGDTLYLDSSALVKVVIDEPESAAVRAFVDGASTCYASALVRAEVPRALRRHGARPAARGHVLVDELDLIELDDALLADASGVGDAMLRTLDAIHLASALLLGDELDALVTYDMRLAEAAREAGLRVEAPG